MSIEDFCKVFNIHNYTVSDGLINTEDTVNLWQLDEDKIPHGFGTVGGLFEISFSNLKTLKGLPEVVGGNLYLVNCSLEELDYLPKRVGGIIDLSFNKLTDVSKLKEVDCKMFKLNDNNLTDLYSLKGLEGTIRIDSNPAGNLYQFRTMDEVNTFNMLKIIKGNVLDLKRLKYFYSLMDHSFNLAIEKIDKFYTIKE